MKPYSIDFRQKIIEVYTEGNISQRHLAQHFRVSLSFVQKLIKQYSVFQSSKVHLTSAFCPLPSASNQDFCTSADWKTLYQSKFVIYQYMY